MANLNIIGFDDSTGQLKKYNAGDTINGVSDINSYTHTQSSAATTWTINHNLGRRPLIILFDSSGNVFNADITHNDLNTATVSVNPAIAGSARAI